MILSPYAAGTCIIPHGIFKQIAEPGFGLAINLGLTNLFFKNSLIMLSSGFNFINEERDNIASFGMPYLSLLTGYAFTLTDNFKITPLVGTGYLLHIIKGSSGGGGSSGNSEYALKSFLDPLFTIQCEFDVALFKGYHIILTPGYIFFFEKNNTGRYLNIALGAKKDFYLKRKIKKINLFLSTDCNSFSPNADGLKDIIRIIPELETTSGIDCFDLKILDKNKHVVRSFTGQNSVSGTFIWDGLDNRGNLMPDGEYIAELELNYQKGDPHLAYTPPFILDNSPPEIALTLKPQPFSPDNDGVDDELLLSIKVDDPDSINAWSIRIDDPKGVHFITFRGKGIPPEKITWNGLSSSGELVQAAENYPLSLEISDNLGNITRLNKDIPVDVLVVREGDKLKIRISSITFSPNSSDLEAVEDEDKAAKNNKTLKRLVEIFQKYNDYRIRIEGHANNLLWDDPVKASEEEIKELIPLSRERALSVKDALLKLGLYAERISTVGLGGKDPIVPFRDTINRWKNRRVEFILIKK